MLPVVVDPADPLVRSPDVVLADARWYLDGRSGREAYLAGHLPGAVFVDVDHDLAAPRTAAGGRHPLPSPADFAAAMSRRGIGDGTTVLAYDDTGGTTAARLVWMLRAVGADAALLDGGLLALGDAPLERGEVRPEPVTFTPRPWPQNLLVDLETAADAARNGPAVVLDVRVPERYRGEVEPVDARPGHVPGARNLPTRGHVDATGRFLAPEALRRRFTEVGVDAPSAGSAGADVVAYCGSGVNATHTLLALEHAGLGRGRLFPGSWSAYAATDRSAATGPERG
jgi:thiosulfate/3-mercaptopyruvate sulfurtransferase